MKNKSLSHIRNGFINYFKKNDHVHLKSSNLVPDNDPTLLFSNSGMVQFKNIFTGIEKREYLRAVTSQKCLRAGGKHNDLENVGHTARHHTFFEMLGNFSFGDYFKEKAIYQAWDLLTNIFKIPKTKLLVTIYHEDEEAEKLWKKIAGLNDSKIIKIYTNDNFWSMGDTGPCGPCSEIFYDHGDKIYGGPPGSKDEDGDRFIEIWNLVFMQYEQINKEKRINLPKPSIDTGMGLERISALLQGTHDNYQIDLFKNLIKASSEVTSSPINDQNLTSHRVIADHIRSSVFLISEGVYPSNEGRGYVLRRILRRAIRHSNILGCNKPFMSKLTKYLIDEMGDAYPELVKNQDYNEKIIFEEEVKFRETLDRGLDILNAEISNDAKTYIFSGKKAFELYDTYGFPLDLTQDVLKSYGWKVDIKTFEAEMEKQKTRARASWSGSGDEKFSSDLIQNFDNLPSTNFIGYESFSCNSRCLLLIKDNKKIDQLNIEDYGDIIFNKTVFYAESGGQIGDTGYIKNKFVEIDVLDCKKINIANKIIFIHKIKVLKGKLSVNDNCDLFVNVDNRKEISSHHTCTHLLHEALREELGLHVKQKGSLVTNEKLRFDFSHSTSVGSAILKKIELAVNQKIFENDEVTSKIMKQDLAIKKGAIALFGEKYGDNVRVVSMGKKIKANRVAWSVELCGGTHLKNIGEALSFKILNETGVASGIRRIEAVARKSAFLHYEQKDKLINEICKKINSQPSIIINKIDQLLSENLNLKQIIKNSNKTSVSKKVDFIKIKNHKFFSEVYDDLKPKDLKSHAEKILNENNLDIVCIITKFNKKVSCVVNVQKDLSTLYNAIDLVNLISEIVDGKPGGGRPDMAQSGGQNIKNIPIALEKLKLYIEKNNV